MIKKRMRINAAFLIWTVAFLGDTTAYSAEATESLSVPSIGATPANIAIAIIDDHSGGKALGALNALTARELDALLDLAGKRTVELSYILIQEKPQTPVCASLSAWRSSRVLPDPPSPTLPNDRFQKKALEFEQIRQELKAERQKWERETKEKFSGWVREATAAQMELEARWTAELQKHGGIDFRRSSVADCMVAAMQSLPVTPTLRVAVLATDGVDEPPGRVSRTAPFTPSELPEDIALVWIDPDGHIPPSPLFKNVRNRSYQATTLGEAIASIVANLSQQARANPTERK